MKNAIILTVAMFLIILGVESYVGSTRPEACIQEVYQGHTVSREAGKLYRDEHTGHLVCTRNTNSTGPYLG